MVCTFLSIKLKLVVYYSLKSTQYSVGISTVNACIFHAVLIKYLTLSSKSISILTLLHFTFACGTSYLFFPPRPIFYPMTIKTIPNCLPACICLYTYRLVKFNVCNMSQFSGLFPKLTKWIFWERVVTPLNGHSFSLKEKKE